MRLTLVHIKNFRGIENIELKFEQRVALIVGPNAIGKTSILEAIRVVKAILLPRYAEEARQVLVAIGALSPNYQFGSQQVDLSAVAGDITKPVEIRMGVKLSSAELTQLSNNAVQVAQALVRSSLAVNQDQAQLQLVQYLSSEEGKARLVDEERKATAYVQSLAENPEIVLCLTFNPSTGAIQGDNQMAQTVLGVIEGLQPPSKSLLSYFPADRAMPAGEVNIQLGAADMAAQVQSHVGQAATKYQRLKQAFVNSLIYNDAKTAKIKDEFNLIFSSLLDGKSFAGFQQSPIGALKVLVTESRSNRTFDIDLMSSGEKGLVLTMALIGQTVGEGGIVMIDEPELHLNPAVCKKLVGYLCDRLGGSHDLQFLLCTHSAEIFGAALQREDCEVFHLRSGKVVSKMYTSDVEEVQEALRRLGTSQMDIFSARGSLYVEGDSDVDILEAGFSQELAGFKLISLGGRQEVEKAVRELQAAETKKTLEHRHCFIFDLDHAPSGLVSSAEVKVIQWQRTCIENFLLDDKSLYDVVHAHAKNVGSRGEFWNTVQELALSQLKDLAIRKCYSDLQPDNPGFRPKELQKKNFDEAAEQLFSSLSKIRDQLSDLEANSWKRTFIEKCKEFVDSNRPKWERDWLILCDGKRVFSDLQGQYSMKLSSIELKKRVMRNMRADRAQTWSELSKKIADGVGQEVKVKLSVKPQFSYQYTLQPQGRFR